MTDVELNHYDGHHNLTQAQKDGAGPTLAEQQKLMYDDFAALEAANTAIKTAPTLTAAAEVADVIAVTMESPVASVEQYTAEVLDTNMDVNSAVVIVAETGVGSEVAGSGTGRLIFKTDSAGEATLSVTDVVGASGDLFYLMVKPLFESGDVAQQCAPVMIGVTFDGV
jgi:hypothetical protein